MGAIFEDLQDPVRNGDAVFSEFLGTFFLVLVAAAGA